LSESTAAAKRLIEIMSEACQVLGVSQLGLRCEWDLETVHVSVEDGIVVALTAVKRTRISLQGRRNVRRMGAAVGTIRGDFVRWSWSTSAMSSALVTS
jgi:hypothetical protein